MPAGTVPAGTVLDGKVIGGWRRIPEKVGITVALTLLKKLGRGDKAALAVTVERFRKFLALPVTLVG